MPLSSFHADVIAGTGGAWTVPLRWALSAGEVGYKWAIARRNRQFESGAREIVRLTVPVISVGNITAGGTGKTPLVIDLASRLVARGRRPGVVSRGYKSRDAGLGDELTLVSERVPEAVCVANPDRVAGGREAVRMGADVIVLDDALQHRRVGRDLDIVVVDATNPFGYEHLLPRGLLREPVDALGRADLIVVSRADMVDDDVLSGLKERVASVAPSVVCRHRPAGLVDLAGNRCEKAYPRAVLLSAIGNPGAFVKTVEQMGIEPVEQCWWSDHHAFDARDVARAVEVARRVAHDVVLTTQKDAVKLRELDLSALEPVRVVEIGIEYLDGGERLIDECLDGTLSV